MQTFGVRCRRGCITHQSQDLTPRSLATVSSTQQQGGGTNDNVVLLLVVDLAVSRVSQTGAPGFRSVSNLTLTLSA